MQEQRHEGSKLDVSVKVYPVKEPGTLLAFAGVTLGGCFSVNGVRVMNGEKGPFVAMPSRKEKDGQYRELCCPTTKEMRQALNAAVLGEYQRAMEKPSVRGALRETAKEAAPRPVPAAQRTADKGTR